MNKHQGKIYGHRSSSQSFLFSKTAGRFPEKGFKNQPVVGLDLLSRKFPYMKTGKDFVEGAIHQLETSLHFGVMLIRPDGLASEDPLDQPQAASLLIDTASAIDPICNGTENMWGLIERDLFGCFFPEKDESACLKLAGDIRSNLGRVRKETLTIGIAVYPLSQFDRMQTAENALKSLVHAGFYGPGGTAVFDAVSLNISGDALYQAGDIKAAVEEFKTALRLDPSNVNVHNSLGVCYAVLGAYPSALDEFETAARIDPHEVMTPYNMGLVHLTTGDKDKALEYFLKADQIRGDVFEAAFQIGRFYLEADRPEKAKEYLLRAVQLNPDSVAAFRYLGEVWSCLGMKSEAMAAYKKAVKLNPGDAAALSALGWLFDQQGENPEIAITFCQHSVEIAPANGLYRHRLGRLHLKLGQYEEALAAFRAASGLGFDCASDIEKVQALLDVPAPLLP
jgi:tetratricopeptide (TPR) repeat protein